MAESLRAFVWFGSASQAGKLVVDWVESVDMTFAANASGFSSRCMGFRTGGKLSSQAPEIRDNAAASISELIRHLIAGLIVL